MMKIMFFTFTLILNIFYGFELYAKSYDLDSLEQTTKKEKIILDKEKITFVLFWATWCPNCKSKLDTQIPRWEKKYTHVNFVPLNIDKDPARVKHYLAKNEITRATFRDPKGVLTKSMNNNVAPYWAIFKWDTKSKRWENLKKDSGFDTTKIEIAFKNSHSRRMIASKNKKNN